ncbi:MAG: hypothetical protein K0S78_2858, partial [Thermomicrobiales bacterium]|nr:hypothetical protein [Thermomicrobiales bacterium]
MTSPAQRVPMVRLAPEMPTPRYPAASNAPISTNAAPLHTTGPGRSPDNMMPISTD